VYGAFLLGERPNDRRVWLDNRLKERAEIFSVSVGGFSVLDDHLHVLVRLHQEAAGGWSDEEVVRRWGRLFQPRNKFHQPLPVSNYWFEWRLKDAAWVAKARQRLQSLSLKAAQTGSVAGSSESAGLEESHWLCPIKQHALVMNWRRAEGRRRRLTR